MKTISCYGLSNTLEVLISQVKRVRRLEKEEERRRTQVALLILIHETCVKRDDHPAASVAQRKSRRQPKNYPSHIRVRMSK